MDIVSDIRQHLLIMTLHQRERLTAWQLRVAADEIERLRLTDAEREAIDTAEASLMRESTDITASKLVRQRLGAAAATLCGLLERTK